MVPSYVTKLSHSKIKKNRDQASLYISNENEQFVLM